MDRLQTMAVFVAIAEEAGFAPAARRLGMSPPSVTRAISELETRLGARLLHRTTRRVTLTQAGARYLSDCRRILGEIEDADRQAAGVHGSPGGIIRITGPVVFGRAVLTPILLELRDHYPDISVATLFIDRVVNLIDEGVDVAIRIAELPDSSLTARRVGQVRRVVCAAPAYLAAKGYPKSPQALSGHDLIEFSHDAPHDALHGAFHGEWLFQTGGRARRIKIDSGLKFNIADPAIAAAIAGRGITKVLSYMVAPHVAAGELEIVLEEFEPPPVPVHVLHKEPGQTSARVRAVVDFLIERLSQVAMLR